MSSTSPLPAFSSVIVAHDYTYEKSDGTKISICKNQIFVLVDRTNDSWWRVKPTAEQIAASSADASKPKFPAKGFYVPAKYVRVIGEDAGGCDGVVGSSCGVSDEKTPTKDAADMKKEVSAKDRPMSPPAEIIPEATAVSASDFTVKAKPK